MELANNVGILVKFYYNIKDDFAKFYKLKSIDYNGKIIFDLGNVSEKDDNIHEDWTYIPLHMFKLTDISEKDFINLIENKDNDTIFKVYEYVETEFSAKQDMNKYRSKDNDIVNIDNNKIVSSCAHNCSSCSACSACSRAFLK